MMSRCEAITVEARAIQGGSGEVAGAESPTRSTPSRPADEQHDQVRQFEPAQASMGEQGPSARSRCGEHDDETTSSSRPGRRRQHEHAARIPPRIRERVDRRVGADPDRIALRGERVDPAGARDLP